MRGMIHASMYHECVSAWALRVRVQWWKGRLVGWTGKVAVFVRHMHETSPSHLLEAEARILQPWTVAKQPVTIEHISARFSGRPITVE